MHWQGDRPADLRLHHMKVYLLSCKLGFLDLALLLPPFNVSPKHEPVFRSPINHSSFPVKQYPFFHQVLSINYVQVLSINQLLDPHKLSLASLVIMQDRGKQVHLGEQTKSDYFVY